MIGALALTAGVAVGVVIVATRPSTPGRSSAPAGPPRLVPGPGQSFVTGQLDRLSADRAQSAPIPAPFTLTAVERGVGRATLANVVVDGKRTTIAWGGGVPLPIVSVGGGALDLGEAPVAVDAGGVTWMLDGAGRTLLPGAYRAAAPVAVGEGGLAQARDSVAFTVDAMSTLTTSGRVVVKRPLQSIELDGPGALTAVGRLRVQSPTSATDAARVELAPAPFHVTVAPSGSGLRLDGVLQGPITIGR